MAEGRRPVMNEKREGAHSGLLQYADRNVMPPAARESRFGVRATEFPYAGSAPGVSWSAMSIRKLGFGMSILLSAAPGPADTIENDGEQHDHKTGSKPMPICTVLRARTTGTPRPPAPTRA